MKKNNMFSRRSFLETTLKGSAAVALFGAAAGTLPRRARAQSGVPRLWLMFDARGAWDTSRLLDPKGGEPYSSHYDEGDILTVSGTEHRYAPKAVVGGTPVPFEVGADGAKEDFFQRYGNELLVVNGIDTQTNSHDIGPRHTWSGTLRSGSPAFAALVAAIAEQDLGSAMPMAFLSTGGYDDPAQLLPPSRVGQVGALLDLAEPYRIAANSTTNFNRFLPEGVEAQIRAAQEARHARLSMGETLPFRQNVYEALDRARKAEPAFAPVHAEFMALPALSAQEAANPLIAKAQVALAAMRADVCVSAMLSFGSFDTHGDHDVNHPLRTQELLDAIDYTMRTLEALGMRDEAVVTVGSDFGRTIYNDTPSNAARGKDHWPITSMMLMGAGIAGGRVIGQTDRHDADGPSNKKGVKAWKVKESGGELVPTGDGDAAGFMLKPGHVHDALRQLAGIREHPLSAKFEIPDATSNVLPLLS